MEMAKDPQIKQTGMATWHCVRISAQYLGTHNS